MRGQSTTTLTGIARAQPSAFLKPRVDQIRRFDLLPSILLGGLVLVGVLFYVWQQIQVVRLGYQIEHIQGERIALIRQEKELRFEVSRLKSLRRVEEIARHQLGFTSPKPGQVIVVE
ncbi:MAG: cell division protein FtsL [candidate division NC10 bacterium]|nr:cell division protein FtsL [candidate division NC10 bacterium]